MKKLLPKNSGFTLIELLVVIAILAILAIVGITLFTTVQQRARDSKRTADIIAMSKAMEVHYVSGTGYVTTIDPNWFVDKKIPEDPNCPGGTCSNSWTVYATNTLTATTFTFCAHMEQAANSYASAPDGTGLGTCTGNTCIYFCKKNAQ